jgi:hypothetical protein
MLWFASAWPCASKSFLFPKKGENVFFFLRHPQLAADTASPPIRSTEARGSHIAFEFQHVMMVAAL